MAHKITVISTIAELEARACASKWESDRRYNLSSWEHQAWDDEAAGLEWNRAESEFDKALWDQTRELPYEERWEVKNAARETWLAAHPKPSQHTVTTFTMKVAGTSSSGNNFELGETLARQVDEVWTKKANRYNPNRKENVGALSLAGLLKRLGRTDIGSQIEAARLARIAREEAALRARQRANVRNNIALLRAAIEAAGNTFNGDPSQMTLAAIEAAVQEPETVGV